MAQSEPSDSALYTLDQVCESSPYNRHRLECARILFSWSILNQMPLGDELVSQTHRWAALHSSGARFHERNLCFLLKEESQNEFNQWMIDLYCIVSRRSLDLRGIREFDFLVDILIPKLIQRRAFENREEFTRVLMYSVEVEEEEKFLVLLLLLERMDLSDAREILLEKQIEFRTLIGDLKLQNISRVVLRRHSQLVFNIEFTTNALKLHCGFIYTKDLDLAKSILILLFFSINESYFSKTWAFKSVDILWLETVESACSFPTLYEILKDFSVNSVENLYMNDIFSILMRYLNVLNSDKDFRFSFLNLLMICYLLAESLSHQATSSFWELNVRDSWSFLIPKLLHEDPASYPWIILVQIVDLISQTAIKAELPSIEVEPTIFGLKSFLLDLEEIVFEKFGLHGIWNYDHSDSWQRYFWKQKVSNTDTFDELNCLLIFFERNLKRNKVNRSWISQGRSSWLRRFVTLQSESDTLSFCNRFKVILQDIETTIPRRFFNSSWVKASSLWRLFWKLRLLNQKTAIESAELLIDLECALSSEAFYSEWSTARRLWGLIAHSVIDWEDLSVTLVDFTDWLRSSIFQLPFEVFRELTEILNSSAKAGMVAIRKCLSNIYVISPWDDSMDVRSLDVELMWMWYLSTDCIEESTQLSLALLNEFFPEQGGKCLSDSSLNHIASCLLLIAKSRISDLRNYSAWRNFYPHWSHLIRIAHQRNHEHNLISFVINALILLEQFVSENSEFKFMEKHLNSWKGEAIYWKSRELHPSNIWPILAGGLLKLIKMSSLSEFRDVELLIKLFSRTWTSEMLLFLLCLVLFAIPNGKSSISKLEPLLSRVILLAILQYFDESIDCETNLLKLIIHFDNMGFPYVSKEIATSNGFEEVIRILKSTVFEWSPKNSSDVNSFDLISSIVSNNMDFDILSARDKRRERENDLARFFFEHLQVSFENSFSFSFTHSSKNFSLKVTPLDSIEILNIVSLLSKMFDVEIEGFNPYKPLDCIQITRDFLEKLISTFERHDTVSRFSYWTIFKDQWLRALHLSGDVNWPFWEFGQRILNLLNFLSYEVLIENCKFPTILPILFTALNQVQIPNNLKRPVLELYNQTYEEVGMLSLLGDVVFNNDDVEACRLARVDPTYGEILFMGLMKGIDIEHLNIWNASVICDLGMGVGKIPLFLFMTFPHLRKISGVEISISRFQEAEGAALNMLSKKVGQECSMIEHLNDRFVSIQDSYSRRLILEQGNILEKTDLVHDADIVFLLFHISTYEYERLFQLLSTLKSGCRILTLEDLGFISSQANIEFPFDQLPLTCVPSDLFLTSWSPERGHHLFGYQKRQNDEDCISTCSYSKFAR